ncbi:excinuclease ABC subunit UvrA [Coxiella endosymbiont of Ornithodoros amblus]|uniref:excinuclease ABC subunit UvrA n=1 Tax=Coxiella endosymbiont of Ornithodoros amblus TaxID=1656166 RepID=UPI00244E3F75|nr:excinuclease ABC subunit UvrA [Coxiella endosymbiont of Ornithodoros amblus]MBW5802817.1 excinuclease ABC subunit UvrA [Coxiella endosymbiont of Ornithodoros amblus]
MSTIQLRGVRTHNLKNIDLNLPRNQLVIITGLSGSGKSSLAFDTLYAEGQRRYVESLSAYARQFLSMMEKPEVDMIEGLSPAIAIEQKSASHNPRSTVGTITEIYDYLRLLYARIGQPCCPVHHHALQAQTISQMVDSVLALPEGTAVMLLAPVIRERKGEHLQLLEQLKSQGFIRARIDGKLVELDEAPKLSLRKKHTIEVVVDRVKVRPDVQQRLAESFETTVRLADGLATVASFEENKIEERTFSERYACPDCGYSLEELEPRLFSFNNPMGACPSCDGLGVQQYFDPEKIIHNEKASLANGAIRGWDRHNLYYYQLLSSLAKHFGFDMEIPYSRLPKSIRQMLLYGSEKEAVTFYLVSYNGKKTKRTHPFEGIISIMERRYRETESQAVREELAKYLTMSECETCQGSRLRKEARHVFLESKNLPEITAMSIGNALQFFQSLELKGKRGKIAEKILKEVNTRLGFLVNVGLNYLNLARSAETLSGGEAQRIRLASQIGSGLVGVMYILDEPSIGLHQRDNGRLLKTLKRLRDLGNTVIVVEHDEDAIRTADYVVDIGPGAGVHGGEIVAEGSPSEIMKNPRSLTGQYLLGKKTIPVPKKRQLNSRYSLSLKGARCNNLKNVDVDIPIGSMTCITGVSGSGKSSLISDTLYPIVASRLNGATQRRTGPYQSISGLEYLDKVVEIDQSPIGRTPRSNPATYTGVFMSVRELFAGTPESRSRGYLPGRFSFNVKGGRCEACEGDGVIKVEMHFLSDIYVVCDVCKGKRYNRETLEVHYKGKNIYDVLQMTVEDAREFFDAIPIVARKLQTLIDVGLSYITLGQSATTLSGGEAQRIKLSRELSKRETGRTLYLLDEPTTGLHFHDILQLLTVLHRLRDGGNTIVVIEHNLDVIKVADWIIDMGPEGGAAGGHVVVAGTPEAVAKCKDSHTGSFLKPILKASFSLKPLPEKTIK